MTDPERIAALERRVAELEAHVAILMDYVGAPRRPTAAAKPELPGDLLALIRAGEKISAIKRYRELYGVGLAEAKAEVERLEQTLR